MTYLSSLAINFPSSPIYYNWGKYAYSSVFTASRLAFWIRLKNYLFFDALFMNFNMILIVYVSFIFEYLVMS